MKRSERAAARWMRAWLLETVLSARVSDWTAGPAGPRAVVGVRRPMSTPFPSMRTNRGFRKDSRLLPFPSTIRAPVRGLSFGKPRRG